MEERLTLDSRPCACGGIVAVVQPALDEDIVRAVRQHNHTSLHLRWVENGGFDQRPRPYWDAYERRPDFANPPGQTRVLEGRETR